MSGRVPLLADLREPPVVGQFYMVPAIEYPYCGLIDKWAVLGPKHSDAEFLQFTEHHYHIDARFLTASQERRILNWLPSRYSTIEECAGGWPLSNRDVKLPDGRPALIKRKCRRQTYGYAFGWQPGIKALHEHFAGREAIRLDDGRILCPHRKADLTQFPPDADGMVTCPLHGLRVCTKAPTQ